MMSEPRVKTTSSFPQELEDREQLRFAPYSSEAYTLPWGMSVSTTGEIFLNSHYPYGDKGGTRCLKVIRDEHGDYHVDAREAVAQGYRWSMEEGVRLGRSSWTEIPVESITFIERMFANPAAEMSSKTKQDLASFIKVPQRTSSRREE